VTQATESPPPATLRAAQAEALRAAANIRVAPLPAPSHAAGLFAAEAVARLRDAIRARADAIEVGK
jgi:hypothetical protein